MSGSGFSSGEASSRQQDWAQAPEGLGMVTDLDHMLSAPLPPLPALASAHTLWLGAHIPLLYDMLLLASGGVACSRHLPIESGLASWLILTNRM